MGGLLPAAVLWGLSPTVAESVELRWSAPAGCPDVDAVSRAIEGNLSREEFGPQLQEVTVEGQIVARPGGWRLSLTVELPLGRVDRSVQSSRCEELADAAGLMIAVALDPLRVVETMKTRAEPAPEPEPEPQPPPQPKPEPQPAPEPEPPQQSRRSFAVDVRLGGVAEFGSVQTVRGGVLGSVGLVLPLFRVDVAAHYLAPRRITPFEDPGDAGVRVQQAGAGARACLTPRVGPIELSTCLGFEGGGAMVRGVGIDEVRRSVVPWAAAVFGQELAWTSRRRFGVWLGADAMVHLVRPRFTVADLGTAVQTQWVGVRVVGGPSVRF